MSRVSRSRPVARVLPPLRNQSRDRGVEPPARPLETARRGERKLLEQLAERNHQETLEELHHFGERTADLVRLLLDVRVEEGLSHDREREPDHLPVDVDRLALLPPLRRALGVADHRLAVSRDPLPVESGLHEPALAQVDGFLRREKALAQEALGALQRAALVVRVRAGDEDRANEFRIVDEVDEDGPEPESRDVAVVAR